MDTIFETFMPILTNTMISLVRQDGLDLTARQLAVLLICDGETSPQTVRGLAQKLSVAKPIISRAIDKLEGMDLLQRRPDLSDRRSVLIRPTPRGRSFVNSLGNIMIEVSNTQQGQDDVKLAA